MISQQQGRHRASILKRRVANKRRHFKLRKSAMDDVIDTNLLSRTTSPSGLSKEDIHFVLL